ncbi:MAG: type II toxin-antitoxin system death-on-curing family toxin [Elusimicrobia bacterium CG_4_9_14_3_um_filter_62_55]|nr:MAG: type II toxin-antitoxin system death-on-curing family toxin [Elusimicrobia bacterium CG22_combo_CG10-13_8_21_14_all_63_91]PJA16904.1 MAG: type II toxin-antitoxin system death-on-curing family toxin [Elusimicrobia bacterium CG_4_10_14_0_2_um_filter_63_34]PJB24904.1 MAG: type II toxin-antitoxin system death-on-curing family toxin [Elusimicrobia bacterium CG_4_9_14_3_um_filter_62_55]
MNYLYPNQVIFLHKRVVEVSGGSHGVRDQGLLESAVYRPQAAFGGADLYPDLFAKAGALGHSIIKNHPFVDGNKRTGLESMRLMLRMNGFDLRAGENQKFDFVMKVSSGGTDEHEIAQWLKAHSRKRL